MTPFFIVAHTPLATALKRVVEHVLGPVEDLIAVDIQANQCAADSADTLATQFIQANQGEGVLVLTDLPGASPSNIAVAAASVARQNGVPCIVLGGVNPAMLLRAINYRQVALEEVAAQALMGAHQSAIRVD